MAQYIIIAESISSKKRMMKGEIHDDIHFSDVESLEASGAIKLYVEEDEAEEGSADSIEELLDADIEGEHINEETD